MRRRKHTVLNIIRQVAMFRAVLNIFELLVVSVCANTGVLAAEAKGVEPFDAITPAAVAESFDG